MFNIYIAAFLGGLVGLVIGLLLGHCLSKQDEPVTEHDLDLSRAAFDYAADRIEKEAAEAAKET